MHKQREHWGSRIGFILAAAGSAIGLGSLWRFPYMTGENGDFIARAYLSRSPEKIVDIWTFAINLIKDTLGTEGLLVALFIIITIALVGAWSPTAGIVLTSFAVLMMKILGFVAFGWVTVTMIFILAIILIVKVKQ